MKQSDLLAAHLRDTTATVEIIKRTAKIRTVTFWVLGAFAFGLFVFVMQTHQRDKANAIAVEEGKIPAVTLEAK